MRCAFFARSPERIRLVQMSGFQSEQERVIPIFMHRKSLTDSPDAVL